MPTANIRKRDQKRKEKGDKASQAAVNKEISTVDTTQATLMSVEEETKVENDLVFVTIVWESDIGRRVEILPQRLS